MERPRAAAAMQRPGPLDAAHTDLGRAQTATSRHRPCPDGLLVTRSYSRPSARLSCRWACSVPATGHSVTETRVSNVSNQDHNPHFLIPYTTYGIIALNVIAWVFFRGIGTEPMLSKSVCRLCSIPGELLQTVPAGTRFHVGPGSMCIIGDTSSSVYGDHVDVWARRLVSSDWQYVVPLDLR